MLNSSRIFIFTLLSSVIGLSACQPQAEPKEQPEEQHPASTPSTATQPALEGEVVKLQLPLPECDGNTCPELSIERLQSNQSFIDQVIDQEIVKRLQQILEIAPDLAKVPAQGDANEQAVSSAKVANTPVPATAQQKLEGQLQPYAMTFLKLDQEVKQLGANHAISLMIKPKILNAKGPVVTVVINSSSYLGGAHGAASQHYYNFDLTQQKPLYLSDILRAQQKEALKKQAYTVFKNWVIDSKLANSIEEYEQVWPFRLSENFYLGQDGLILQYDEYEIGPYVVGLPRLVIPYSQLGSILKADYLPGKVAKEQKLATGHTEK